MERFAIYFNEKKFNDTVEVNRKIATAINEAFDGLKEKGYEFADDGEMAQFIVDAHSYAKKQIAIAKMDFEQYISTLPKSVQRSLQFNDTDIIDDVEGAYKKIQKAIPCNFRLLHLTVENGVCDLYKKGLERLRENSTTYSTNPKALEFWERANKIADELNKLKADIKASGAIVEPIGAFGGWHGLIYQTDSGYSTSPESITLLDLPK